MMSVDQRIREGLLRIDTELPQPDVSLALDTVLARTRSSSRRRRWVALSAVAAVAAAVVGVVVVVSRPHGDARPVPAVTTTETSSIPKEAARLIAEGRLTSYAVHDSGATMTLWTTCPSQSQAGCSDYAWRLDTGTASPAGGVVPPGKDWRETHVRAAGDGFLITAEFSQKGLIVALDGTTKPIVRPTECTLPSDVEPGRHILVPSALIGQNLVDLEAATTCNVDSEAYPELAATYSATGTRWALTSDTTITWTDGARSHSHQLPDAQGDIDLAVSGPRVAVLQSGDDNVFARLTVTKDNGATWSELDPAEVPFATYDSMAFAGTSAFFVADATTGTLWRSTDLVNFNQVETPDWVRGLLPADDAVLAQVGSSDDLIRVTAEGKVEPIVTK